MQKYQLELWTDEMVYMRGALQEQFDRYCRGWRKSFIEHGAFIADVYLPAISANRRTRAKIDKVMPPIMEERA